MPRKATPLFLVYGGDDFDGCAYRVLGRAIAALELTRDAMWTPSSRHDHITVWAPASTLLRHVLQCKEISHE